MAQQLNEQDTSKLTSALKLIKQAGEQLKDAPFFSNQLSIFVGGAIVNGGLAEKLIWQLENQPQSMDPQHLGWQEAVQTKTQHDNQQGIGGYPSGNPDQKGQMRPELAGRQGLVPNDQTPGSQGPQSAAQAELQKHQEQLRTDKDRQGRSPFAPDLPDAPAGTSGDGPKNPAPAEAENKGVADTKPQDDRYNPSEGKPHAERPRAGPPPGLTSTHSHDKGRNPDHEAHAQQQAQDDAKDDATRADALKGKGDSGVRPNAGAGNAKQAR